LKQSRKEVHRRTSERIRMLQTQESRSKASIILLSVLITRQSEGRHRSRRNSTLAAGSPALMLLTGHSLPNVQRAIGCIAVLIPETKLKIIPVDRSSQALVRETAAKIDSSVQKLDILVKDAAIVTHPWAKTVDRSESQFGSLTFLFMQEDAQTMSHGYVLGGSLQMS